MKDRSVLYFLDAYDDDNLSDGAWWSRLEEGVTAWNELNNDNLDPHEIVSQYVAKQAAKDNVSIDGQSTFAALVEKMLLEEVDDGV